MQDVCQIKNQSDNKCLNQKMIKIIKHIDLLVKLLRQFSHLSYKMAINLTATYEK